MSKKPPRDDDPLLQEILSQIKNSFADLDEHPFLNPELLDTLGHEINVSLHTLMGKEPENPSPIVSVVEGGQERSGDSIERSVPELHIANPKDYSEPNIPLDDVEQEGEESSKGNDLEGDVELFSSIFGAEGPNVEVRVFGPEELSKLQSELKQRGEGGNDFSSHGKIAIFENEEQLVYYGQSLHTYRIHVDEGALAVFVDQKEVTCLQMGQSCDVESRHIYVKAESALIEGRYELLFSAIEEEE
jgi:hypothetical protein